MSIPPKPKSRNGRVSLWGYMRLFKADILSAQPERLYSAWMAEFRTPFFRSYMANDPDLVGTVLKDRPDDFPKSSRVAVGLSPLLGRSVFLTNGAEWRRQRRMIDPAFDKGRLDEVFPAMLGAAEASAARIRKHADTAAIDIEKEASHAAADVIFRALFSVPVDDGLAADVFRDFAAFQSEQPLLNLRAFVPVPSWVKSVHRARVRDAARRIRASIARLVDDRLESIERGDAPDDLATRLLTTPDPETGQRFDRDEMIDQVAIFFLAGHETSAAAFSWTLYLLATHPEWQERVAKEAQEFKDDFGQIRSLKDTRDVFREALRLYPPVPMMVRETTRPEVFRKRAIRRGSQVVVSLWHLHRHARLWARPDEFAPDRWQQDETKQSSRQAFLPFSAGPRVCSGAGFAMLEGVLLTAIAIRSFRFTADDSRPPVPVARLTVRSKDGIWLRITHRS